MAALETFLYSQIGSSLVPTAKSSVSKPGVRFSATSCNRASKQQDLHSQFSGIRLSADSTRRANQFAPRVKSSARAETSASGQNADNKIAPLELVSPAGQFLSQLLQNHPHLLGAAAEQQLERINVEREEQEAMENDMKETSGAELVLYKRIADVRVSERKRAIEEVMYALIVQRFIESGLSLMPKIPFLPADELSPEELMAAFKPVNEKELLSIHSEDAKDMIKDHLDMILKGVRPEGFSSVLDDRILLVASKLKLGQVYAASALYGYFLRRVDQRFQFEKSMTSLLGQEERNSETVDSDSSRKQSTDSSTDNDLSKDRDISNGNTVLRGQSAVTDFGRPPLSPLDRAGENGLAEAFSAAVAEMAHSGQGAKQSPLRRYIGTFNHDTLVRNATLRSSEGLSVVEKHTEALFGKPEIVMTGDGGLAVLKNDGCRLSISTLRRMVLEAAAFGSFLWDIESYVDTQYTVCRS